MSSSSSDYWSSSSSYEERPSVFHEFLEIRTESGSSSSSGTFDSVTVMLLDAQLSTRIELAAGREDKSSTCYYFSFDDECPEGYSFSGFADGCVGTCDKLCCPTDTSVDEPVLCGQVYLGSRSYNTPWDFYVLPESISLMYEYDAPADAVVGLDPATIEASLLDGSIQEGSEYCIRIRNRTRPMVMTGPGYCIEPLQMRATRVFDDALGEYVQETVCEGDCENIVDSWCMDAEIAAGVAENDAAIAEVDSQFASMTDAEIESYYLDNIDVMLAGIDGDLDTVETIEEIEAGLIAEVSAPSSSSSDDYASPIVFDYEYDFVSPDENSPSFLPLIEGENYIISATGGSALADAYFYFEVPAGANLVEVSAVAWTSTVGSATVAIQTGAQWAASAPLEESPFGVGLDYRLLISSLPLGSGAYTIKVSSSGPETSYVLLLAVQ